jgi:putative Mg2+ transporter-C (MgtC) family protein
MLVSVGSALLMIVSAYGFSRTTEMPDVVLDPSRGAAQVVSGIGLLGACSILLWGQVVKGLTTATSVWSVAAIGLAAGGGLYCAAVLATGIILVNLIGIKPLEEAYRSRGQSAIFRVLAERGSVKPDRVKKLLGVRCSQPRRIVTIPAENELEETRLHLTKVRSVTFDWVSHV